MAASLAVGRAPKKYRHSISRHNFDSNGIETLDCGIHIADPKTQDRRTRVMLSAVDRLAVYPLELEKLDLQRTAGNIGRCAADLRSFRCPHEAQPRGVSTEGSRLWGESQPILEDMHHPVRIFDGESETDINTDVAGDLGPRFRAVSEAESAR